MSAGTTAPNGTVTVADVAEAAEIIRLFVIEQGQATKAEIREHCKGHGVGTDVYQKAMARLANQLKMLTEETREDGTKAFRVKRWLHGCTVRDFAEQMEEVKGPAKPRERYEDWQELRGYLTLTSPALASRPVLGETGARQFLRVTDALLLLPSGNYRAMFQAAAQKPGAPDIGNARFRVEWDQQTLDTRLIGKLLQPVPPRAPGQAGQGLIEVEMLPPGTRIPFTAVFPQSHIRLADFATLLVIAGRWVGFSPAAAHLGWGRFEPELAHATPSEGS